MGHTTWGKHGEGNMGRDMGQKTWGKHGADNMGQTWGKRESITDSKTKPYMRLLDTCVRTPTIILIMCSVWRVGIT